MYLTLRRYGEIGARMYEIAFRKVEAGLVPMLKARPGFRLYCALLNEEGEGVSVTAFDEREQAIRANERVFGWVEANLRDLLPNPPEVVAGECGIVEVSPGWRACRGQRPPIVGSGSSTTSARRRRPARPSGGTPCPSSRARPGSGRSTSSGTSGSPHAAPV